MPASGPDLDRKLDESRRLLALANLIHELDGNPAHGAALARKALLLLSRVILATRGDADGAADEVARAQDLNARETIVEIDLATSVALLDRLAGAIDGEVPAAAADREAYERILRAGPRLHVQAAGRLGRALPARGSRRTVAAVTLGFVALAAVAPFVLRNLPSPGPGPEPQSVPAVPASPQAAAPPPSASQGLTLPAALVLGAEQAALGPVGPEIRISRSSGVYRATVEARGTECPNPGGGAPPSEPQSRYPAIEMRIDGKSMALWYLDSEAPKKYSSDPFTLDGAAHTVQFFSVNDYYAPGKCDRNVWLDRAAFVTAEPPAGPAGHP